MSFNFSLRLFRKHHSNYEIEDLYGENIRNLGKFLNYKIKNPHFFLKAITHSSYLDNHPDLKKSNERLEYLGDAVLSLIVGEYLFENFPNQNEGYLTKIRSHLVDKIALAKAAETIKLDKYLLFEKRYINDSAEGLKTITADALEALIGALYLDGGLETVRKFILTYIINPNLKSGYFEIDHNFKGKLLELTHSRKLSPPEYKLIKAEGPDHNRIFTIKVMIGDKIFGIGTGKNKKNAEQKAAKIALTKLK